MVGCMIVISKTPALSIVMGISTKNVEHLSLESFKTNIFSPDRHAVEIVLSHSEDTRRIPWEDHARSSAPSLWLYPGLSFHALRIIEVVLSPQILMREARRSAALFPTGLIETRKSP